MIYKIFILYFIFTGFLYSQPIVKTVNGFDNFKLGADYAEPYIITNPLDPLNSVCVFYFRTSGLNRAYYTLDGCQWNIAPVNFGYFNAGPDPFVAADKYGNFYYTVITGTPNANGISVAKSTNGGISWQAYRLYNGIVDKECVVADVSNGPYGGYIYCAWQSFISGSNTLQFSRSINGGINWSQPLSFSSQKYFEWSPYLAIGPNGSTQGGTIYYGYDVLYTSDDTTTTFKIRRSTDGGLNFSDGTVVAQNMTQPSPVSGIHLNQFFQIAADNSYGPHRGNVYVICNNNPPGPDNSDIIFIMSSDNGTTWSVPRKINDDNTLTNQWMPAISCDKETGKVFVSWYDSRLDPANYQVHLYGTVSSDGGNVFSTSTAITNEPFSVYTSGFAQYWGHYIGISAIKNTSYAAWADGRDNILYGSYTAFYPDFAYLSTPEYKVLGNNDSFNVVLKIPAVNGPFNQTIKFSAEFDTNPPSGIITTNFINRDSINTIPDSLILKVKTIGSVTPGNYKLTITAKATDGVPVHKRFVDLLVNYSYLSVETSRNGILNFKVNGNTYNTKQIYYLPNNTTVNVQAITPQVVSLKKYDFLNWTDNGDTIHNVTLNNSYSNLRANYKVQFKLIMDTVIGNTFGGNIFYDSAGTASFGVLSRTVTHNGNTYRFAGWNGNGLGSYNSPDSLGLDTAVSLLIRSVISENPRWVSLIGIVPISSEIPRVYKLHANYPNPFNPVTKIKFDIIKNTNTKLVVYDILGRVVKILINGELLAGKYEVNFDGSRFSSGVYFYKLETNDFVDTKKMLMIK